LQINQAGGHLLCGIFINLEVQHCKVEDLRDLSVSPVARRILFRFEDGDSVFLHVLNINICFLLLLHMIVPMFQPEVEPVIKSLRTYPEFKCLQQLLLHFNYLRCFVSVVSGENNVTNSRRINFLEFRSEEER